ncbi:MAG: mevalonate kinase [Myxococcota bacterium]|jgi:mevalonate kinase|nr:mevalonate kinase [Myxococcota bacterium]
MTGTAHGKVIVLGEHAVVHGEPALAAAIAARVTLELELQAGPGCLELTNVALRARVDDGSRLGEALLRLVESLGVPREGWALRGSCFVPLGGGLGSSAAIAAASVRALCSAHGLVRSQQEMFDAVQASEAVFHGTPSGIDAAVALRGGALRFTKASGVTPLEVRLPRLVVVYSGQPKDTKIAVERFTQALADRGDLARARLRRIGELVDIGIEALARDDLSALGEAMNENHEHLCWFGVSTAALDRICEGARKSGALGAKLTGAGGGGSAIVLTKPGDDAPVVALRGAGFQVVAS